MASASQTDAGVGEGLLESYAWHTTASFPSPPDSPLPGTSSQTCGVQLLGNFRGEGLDRTYVLSVLVSNFSGHAWKAEVDITDLAEYFRSKGADPYPLSQIYEWLEDALEAGSGVLTHVSSGGPADHMNVINIPLVLVTDMQVTSSHRPMQLRLPPEGALMPLTPDETQIKSADLFTRVLKLRRMADMLCEDERLAHRRAVVHLKQERAALLLRTERLKDQLRGAFGMAFKDNMQRVERHMEAAETAEVTNEVLSRAKAAVMTQAEEITKGNGNGNGGTGDGRSAMADAAALVLTACAAQVQEQQQHLQLQSQLHSMPSTSGGLTSRLHANDNIGGTKPEAVYAGATQVPLSQSYTQGLGNLQSTQRPLMPSVFGGGADNGERAAKRARDAMYEASQVASVNHAGAVGGGGNGCGGGDVGPVEGAQLPFSGTQGHEPGMEHGQEYRQRQGLVDAVQGIGSQSVGEVQTQRQHLLASQGSQGVGVMASVPAVGQQPQAGRAPVMRGRARGRGRGGLARGGGGQ